jgi:valyl-tRNA synthetase
VIDPQPGEPKFVEIATTRPETMLGDTAVAVHPNPAKALDEAAAEITERLNKASGKDREPLEAQLAEIARRRAEMLPELETLARHGRPGVSCVFHSPSARFRSSPTNGRSPKWAPAA